MCTGYVEEISFSFSFDKNNTVENPQQQNNLVWRPKKYFRKGTQAQKTVSIFTPSRKSSCLDFSIRLFSNRKKRHRINGAQHSLHMFNIFSMLQLQYVHKHSHVHARTFYCRKKCIAIEQQQQQHNKQRQQLQWRLPFKE